MTHCCFCIKFVRKKVDNDVDRVSEYFQELLNCLERAKKKMGLMIADAMNSILIV